MYRKWLLAAGVADLFILSLLDRIAFQHYFYWRFGWFDILMHLIGGLAIGLVSAYVFWEWDKAYYENEENHDPAKLSWKHFTLFNLAFILVIGLGWEIFEVIADRIVRFSWLNSASDLFFGIVGSLVGCLIAGFSYLWIHKQTQKK